MKLLICEQCGGRDFFEQDGYRICCYCRSKYIIQSEDMAPKNSIIALNDDIERLLKKCHDDPANARKYANLILDIDPSNAAAKKYI